METTPDSTPYARIDQASNGLPLVPNAENRRESNFRRIDRSPRATTTPSRLEAERAEGPNYPRVRRHSGPGDDQLARAERTPSTRDQSEIPPSTAKPWWQAEALTVADVMTTRPRTVRPDASVREIAELMLEEDVGVVPVVEADGRLWGIVTDRDIVIRGLVKGRSVGRADYREDLQEALQKISGRRSFWSRIWR